MGMAQKFESAYHIKLTEAQARKVVSDIYEQLHGEQLYHASVRKFFSDWLANKKAELQPGAYKRYENAVDKLLAFLAERADRDIAYVHKRDITALRDRTASKLSASTANTDLKILRSAFRQAVSDGLRLDNPATAVSELADRKAPDDPERRPFTEAELK
jgi:site-specific recombinase XerD